MIRKRQRRPWRRKRTRRQPLRDQRRAPPTLLRRPHLKTRRNSPNPLLCPREGHPDTPTSARPRTSSSLGHSPSPRALPRAPPPLLLPLVTPREPTPQPTCPQYKSKARAVAKQSKGRPQFLGSE